MKNQFYTEQKHRETMNSVDMLEGLINRMCVTNDIDELRHLLTSSMCSLSELYVVEREKLKERFSQNAHTESEINLIKSYHRRNKHTGLVMLYVKLVQAGYKRSITSLYRQLRKLNAITVKLPNPKIKPKKYETMFYCGQRVQIDVKVVPTSCIIGIEKYYQYTAIDEYSRKRFLMAFKEQSTYSTYQFVNALQNAWKFKIECIQTDNGSEFTNRFTTNKDKPSLLDLWCEQHNCIHKLIKPMTPRHNGKVERSHRKDNEYFYATHKFYDFEDFKRQLKRWNYQYNNIPTRSLDWKTPQSVYNDYIKFGEVYEFKYNK